MKKNMNVSKRQFLKLLPLAALSATAVKVNGQDAKAIELSPEKKYLFVFPDASDQEIQAAAKVLRERHHMDALVTNSEHLAVYELQ